MYVKRMNSKPHLQPRPKPKQNQVADETRKTKFKAARVSECNKLFMQRNWQIISRRYALIRNKAKFNLDQKGISFGNTRKVRI